MLVFLVNDSGTRGPLYLRGFFMTLFNFLLFWPWAFSWLVQKKDMNCNDNCALLSPWVWFTSDTFLPQSLPGFFSLVQHKNTPFFMLPLPRDPGSTCDACTEDGTFHQYVYKASSGRVCDSSGYWTPEEAVGKVPWIFFHKYFCVHWAWVLDEAVVYVCVFLYMGERGFAEDFQGLGNTAGASACWVSSIGVIWTSHGCKEWKT